MEQKNKTVFIRHLTSGNCCDETSNQIVASRSLKKSLTFDTRSEKKKENELLNVLTCDTYSQ